MRILVLWITRIQRQCLAHSKCLMRTAFCVSCPVLWLVGGSEAGRVEVPVLSWSWRPLEGSCWLIWGWGHGRNGGYFRNRDLFLSCSVWGTTLRAGGSYKIKESVRVNHRGTPYSSLQSSPPCFIKEETDPRRADLPKFKCISKADES